MKARSKAQISAQMRLIKKKGTKPELVVRKIAHRLGFRFRLYRADLPGTHDIVFPSRQKAILVHGCFWHQHTCALGAKQPKTNRHYWLPKLTRNVSRDETARRALMQQGWDVLVIWECEIRDIPSVTKGIDSFLGPKTSRTSY